MNQERESMKYQSPVRGDFMDSDGVVYPQCKTDEQLTETIEDGSLLAYTEFYEVWEHKGIVAVIANEIGILEQ